MPKNTKPISRIDEKRSGVTLIEILIVTVIIGLMASLSFPAFKIMQQREKERRLHKILNDVHSAIAGSKSQQSTISFDEGYRTFVRVQGIKAIENAHPLLADTDIATAAIALFVKNLAENGLGYPLTPSRLISNVQYSYEVATGPTSISAAIGSVTIVIGRRFLRTIPPHPFQNWYPSADWKFKPAYSNPAGIQPLTHNAPEWTNVAPPLARGVANILSRGAGLGLDGSNTDDWE